MKLGFKYSESEFIRAMNQSTRDTRRWYIDFALATVLLAYGIYLYINGSNGFFVSFLIVISVYLMVAIFIRMIIVPRVLFRREPKYKEQYDIEFLDDEIRLTAGALKSSIPWSYYKNSKETKEFIYLIYSRRGFTIIPKRVFNSLQEMDTFLNLIRTKLMK